METLNDFFGTGTADTATILTLFVAGLTVVALGAWVTWRDRKKGN